MTLPWKNTEFAKEVGQAKGNWFLPSLSAGRWVGAIEILQQKRRTKKEVLDAAVKRGMLSELGGSC